MKKLILKQLAIHNFQSFNEKVLDFSPKETNISGDNGVGKTTVFSAYTWLLFGKDSLMREKFDIKPRNRKEPSDVDVEGSFELITEHSRKRFVLRRVLHEKWSDLGEYKGDETRCYIDGIVTKPTEYAAYLNDFAPEKELSILTYPNYFLSLDTKAQRDFLCQMAGERAIEDVLADNKRLLEAYQSIPEGVSIDDFTKKTETEVKEMKDKKKGIQPAIDALLSTMPSDVDEESIKKEREELTDKLKRVEGMILSSENCIKEKIKERSEIFQKIEAIKGKINALKSEKENKILILRKKHDAIILKAKGEQEERVQRLSLYKQSLSLLEEHMKAMEAKKERMYAELDSLMKEYNKVNTEGNIRTCPYNIDCAYLRSGSEEDMEKYKQARLDAIMKEGRAKNAEYEKVQSEIISLERDIENKKKEIDATKKAITDYVPPVTSDIKEEEDKINVSYGKVIYELEEEQRRYQCAYDSFEITDNTDKDKLMAERAALQGKINDLQTLSLQVSLRASINEKIEEKKKEGVALASKIIAKTELLEDLKSIKTAIIKDSSQRINDMFAITHWEVTELLKNGTYKDTCKPFVDGVSASLNAAMALNVRLDICQTISNYLGIYLPLFIDARESCNRTIDLSMQVINLRVAPSGTPLTIN